MKAISDLSKKYSEHYRLRGHEILQPRSLISPSFPTAFLMSAGFEDIQSLAKGMHSDKKRLVVVQPCFRYFDAFRNDRRSHLSLFLMGGALYGPGWNINEVMDALLSFLLSLSSINRDRLWLTYFAGGNVAGLDVDQDLAFLQKWEASGLPRDQTVQLGAGESFWIQGGAIVPGKSRFCGPQIEVFYDLSGAACAMGKACMPPCNCGRFLELTNLISIRFIRTESNHLQAIDAPLCESVVGFERLLMAVEGIDAMWSLSGVSSMLHDLALGLPQDSAENLSTTFQIYERLRSFCFLIAEGAVPSGKGRGYVLRRLFRSAVAAGSTLPGNPKTRVREIVETILKQEHEIYGRMIRLHGDDIRRVLLRELNLVQENIATI
jgi:alanyl-tRNA synthetase